tara:strand:+ start:15884 stop:16663 length:780 start_codon:yes stop_codon:yes gene_type:complete
MQALECSSINIMASQVKSTAVLNIRALIGATAPELDSELSATSPAAMRAGAATTRATGQGMITLRSCSVGRPKAKNRNRDSGMMNKLPKAQSYPTTIIKVGGVLYRVFAITNEAGNVEVRVTEWVVRTIRAQRNSLSRGGVPSWDPTPKPKKVNLCQRNQFTWVKVKGKPGTFSWASKIWAGYKEQFSVGGSLPFGMYTTKRAAARFAIADTEETILWLENELKTESDPRELAELNVEYSSALAELNALKRKLNALAKK